MLSHLSQKLYVPNKGDFQLSGNFSLLGLLMSLAVSMAGITVAAYVYALAVAIIPIVYFNFLLVVAYGMAIGYIVIYASRWGLIRNSNARYFVLVAGVVWGMLIQWYVYLFFLVFSTAPWLSNLDMARELLNSELLSAIFTSLYNEGAWSLFGFQVNGNALLGVWLGEFLIIAIAAILMLLQNPIGPFSETLMKWYPKKILRQDFAYVSGINSFIQKVLETKGECFLDYPKGDGNRHAKVSVYLLPSEAKAYLSVDNVFISSGQKASKEIDPVLRFSSIPFVTAKDLIEKHGTEGWSFFNH